MGADCFGIVIIRKLANATNGWADNTNQQMPNYVKPDTEQKACLLKWGPGLQSLDRNTYQLASHAEWNPPKTGFIISSSWPITIDRTADERAHFSGSSLPWSQSTWATNSVMEPCGTCLHGINSCLWGIQPVFWHSLPWRWTGTNSCSRLAETTEVKISTSQNMPWSSIQLLRELG